MQRTVGEERYQRILDSILTLDSDAVAATAAECNFDESWLDTTRRRRGGDDGQQTLLQHHGFEVTQRSMVMTASAMVPIGNSSRADPVTPEKKYSPYGPLRQACVGR